MSATTSGQSVPVKETVTLPPAMAALQKWRNADHEDRLTLTRDDVITLIEEEWSALLAARAQTPTDPGDGWRHERRTMLPDGDARKGGEG